jgi:RNA polymerase sigma-70 factor (ECF subfamily)
MPEAGKEYIKNLVTEAKGGNEAAFSEIYRNFITPIYRFVYFRVGSKEEAEDLTQTVFLRAWRALEKFDEKTYFSSWLYAIARNAVIDFWKKKKYIPLEDLEDELFETPDFEFFEKEADFLKVKSAIKNLNEDQQEIIALRFIEDLSNAEVAKKIGKSEVAIRQIQCRAIKQLRDILC